MDPVVHFEFPVDDLERAKKFYSEAFGWNVVPFGEKYQMAYTAEVDENYMIKEAGRINGGMFKGGNVPMKGPLVVIEVGDLDTAIGKIKAAGGEIVHDKMEIGEIGWSAYFRDPEGNINCAFESKRAKGV